MAHFPLGFIYNPETGYTPAGAVKVDNGDYLTWTPSTLSSRRTWVFSAWIKRSNMVHADDQTLLGAGTTSTGYYTNIAFHDTGNADADQLYVASQPAASTSYGRETVSLNRDVGAWYNFICVYDSTQSVANDRIKIFVNGSLVTLEDTYTGVPQHGNDDWHVNNTVPHYLGKYCELGQYFRGYMADIIFLDGLTSTLTIDSNNKLTNSEFGEFSNGIWVPKNPLDETTGVSNWGGENSYYLNFADGNNVGRDVKPTAITANPGTYKIDKSVWLDGAYEYLWRTPTIAGNAMTWTFSTWVKRGSVSTDRMIFGSGDWNSAYTALYFQSDGKLAFHDYTGSAWNTQFRTAELFRDPTAWYHIVLSYDSTSTDLNSWNGYDWDSTFPIKLFINGIQITFASIDGTPDLPTQNTKTTLNTVSDFQIGEIKTNSPGYLWDGYLAETIFVDGSALNADSFGGYDAKGIWMPIEYIAGTPDSALSVSHTADAVSSSDLTTYTFSSQAIGTANAARVIAVGVNINGGTSGQHEISSITVGGVSLSQASKHQISTEHSDEIWYGTVPTGTSADVVVTANQATDRCAIDVWNVGNGAVLYASGDAGSSTDVDTVSTIIDVPDGSVTVAHGHYSWGLASWTGLTEDSDRQMETTTYAGGASVATASATALTVTLDSVGYLSTGIGSQSFAAATFAPASNGAYGTNGFHLKFADADFLGRDVNSTAPPTYIPGAIEYTASTDIIYKSGLTSLTDSKVGWCSFWVNFRENQGSTHSVFHSDNGRFQFGRDSSNKIYIQAKNSSDTLILLLTATTATTDTTGWVHCAASWDLAAAEGALFLNGVDDLAGGSTLTNDTIDYSVDYWGSPNTVANWNVKNLYVADIIIAISEKIDLSSNISKLIDSDGYPVDPGSDGSTPSGTQPEFFFHIDRGETPANFAVNAGSEGNFSVTGTLTESSLSIYGNSFTALGSPSGQVTDSPTNTAADNEGNYPTFNPLFSHASAALSNGNKTMTTSTWGYSSYVTQTLPTSGKYYFEVEVTTQGVNWTLSFTVGPFSNHITTQETTYGNHSGYQFELVQHTSGSNGQSHSGTTWEYYGNSSNTNWPISAWSNGDVIGIAYDADNNAIWASHNDVWTNLNGSDSSAAIKAEIEAGTTTNAARVDANVIGAANAYLSAGGNSAVAVSHTLRISPAEWSYSAPSGFVAWGTQNLPAVTIDPRAHFASIIYEGTSFTRSVRACFDSTGTAWTPDLAWIKERTTAGYHHSFFDSIRESDFDTKGRYLYGNGNYAHSANYGDVFNKFISGGFDVGEDGSALIANQFDKRYAAWCWKAGGQPTATNANSAGATPTAGSVKIDGSNLGSALAGSHPANKLSANTTSGFSIVQWTGSGSADTIGHHLNLIPKMIMVKNFGEVEDWVIYHEEAGVGHYLRLNTQDDREPDTGMWQNALPGTDTFNVSAGYTKNNESGKKYIAYVFAEIDGYSKFGSYIGNGDASGPFIYLGFRPAFWMHKRTDISSSDDWRIVDSPRDPYNPVENRLAPNNDAAESTYAQMTWDFTSNGVKLRGDDNGYNDTGATYIYAAFAETPSANNNRAR